MSVCGVGVPDDVVLPQSFGYGIMFATLVIFVCLTIGVLGFIEYFSEKSSDASTFNTAGGFYNYYYYYYIINCLYF
jgi:hypothetical protein